MNAYRSYKLIYIILSIIFILSGACMALFPDFFAFAICYITGGICIVHGVMRLIGYFSNELYKIAFQFDLALGMVSVFIGLICVFNAEGVLKFIPIIIGIFTLISGALKIQSSLDARRFGMSKWWAMLIGSVITMILGALLILCSLESMYAMIVILGITLIIDGIQSLFLLIYAVKYRGL